MTREAERTNLVKRGKRLAYAGIAVMALGALVIFAGLFRILVGWDDHFAIGLMIATALLLVGASVPIGIGLMLYTRGQRYLAAATG